MTLEICINATPPVTQISGGGSQRWPQTHDLPVIYLKITKKCVSNTLRKRR